MEYCQRCLTYIIYSEKESPDDLTSNTAPEKCNSSLGFLTPTQPSKSQHKISVKDHETFVPYSQELETSTTCYAAVDRVISEVLPSKDGGGAEFLERDKTVRQLVLIKRQYIFICSFNKYVLSGDHGLSTELSTEDIVMNK